MAFPAIRESLPPGRSKKRFDYSRTTPKATFRAGEGPNDVGSSRFHLINAIDAGRGDLNRFELAAAKANSVERHHWRVRREWRWSCRRDRQGWKSNRDAGQ